MFDDIIDTNTFWLYLIVCTSILAVLIELFCLTAGFGDLFPYFFLVPTALVIYAFPKKGILFTVGIGLVFIALVYRFGAFSPRIVIVNTAWFFIFVAFGVVLSCRVISSRHRKQQVEQNLQQFEKLNDQIRNSLQIILLDTDTMIHDKGAKDDIVKQVKRIDKILSRVEENASEPEKAR